MSKTHPQPETAEKVPSGKAKDGPNPFAEIADIARRSSSSSVFFANAMTCLVRAFCAPYGAIHVRFAAEIVDRDAHTGTGDPNFWKGTVHQFLTDSLTEPKPQARLLRARSGRAKLALLSAPIFSVEGSSIGAVAMVVAVADDHEWNAKLASLESLCRYMSATSELVGRENGESASSQTGAIGEQAMSKAWRCESAEQFAFSITNELQNKLGLEQVALAIRSRSRAMILSISGLDNVNARSPGVVALRSAMEECLDVGEPIIFERGAKWGDDSDRPIYLLHKQWHAAAKGDAVASIPLKDQGQTMAVLSLRSPADRPLSREKIELVRKRVEPITPALLLAQAATRGMGRHLLDTLWESYDAVFCAGRIGRKVAAAVGLAAVLVFAFGSMNYNLNIACKVAPAELRHLSAPFEGRLEASYVVAGDRVVKGQLLAEIDTEDLVQQRRELEAQWQVYEREQDRALALDRPSDAQVALANRKLIDARLTIVKRRIERASIVAPFDGIVIAGDLRASVGMIFTQGVPLFRIARLDRWKLKIEVPERAAGDVCSDLTGTFASFTEPHRQVPIRMVHVSPSATIMRGKNVFVAEADVESDALSLRPGMEGIARVHVGRRPIRWVALHRILDYLYFHFWL